MHASKSSLFVEILRCEGHRLVPSSDPFTIRFERAGLSYGLDVDDADPEFFAVRADFEVPAGTMAPDQLLALGHDLGLLIKSLKVFSSADGRRVVLNVEGFVPGAAPEGLRAVLRRALRVLDCGLYELAAAIAMAQGGRRSAVGQA